MTQNSDKWLEDEVRSERVELSAGVKEWLAGKYQCRKSVRWEIARTQEEGWIEGECIRHWSHRRQDEDVSRSVVLHWGLYGPLRVHETK